VTARIEAICARHAARMAIRGEVIIGGPTEDDDMAVLLAEIERLRAAINEYDPADALHEMLDIDPTDPVNARAHRKAHERRMGEWHDRVVGRDRVINAMADALFEDGPDELTRLCNAQQVFKAWESNSAHLAPVAPDAEPGGA
jgi:hypothetical protein